jgi:hypothetical protein
VRVGLLSVILTLGIAAPAGSITVMRRLASFGLLFCAGEELANKATSSESNKQRQYIFFSLISASP